MQKVQVNNSVHWKNHCQNSMPRSLNDSNHFPQVQVSVGNHDFTPWNEAVGLELQDHEQKAF